MSCPQSGLSHRGPFRVGAATPRFEISIVPARDRNTRRPRLPQRSSSRLVRILASRAIVDTLAPGSSVAATNRCFSAALQRRRRSTDVMTSTRPFVM